MSLHEVSELFQTLALISTFAGVLILVVCLVAYQNLILGLPLALDFWMAGGFLKLTGIPSWSTIATVAVLVIIRKIVVQNLDFRASEKRDSSI